MKNFTPGKLRNYVMVGAASVIMAGLPKQISAQTSQQGNNVETVDFKPLNEREKNVYNAAYDVLQLNMGEEDAEKFASKIIIDARKYDDKTARQFIEGAVKVALGEKYGKMLEESTTEVNAEFNKESPRIKTTVNVDSDGVKRVTTTVQANLSINQLNPQERQEYNLLKAKLETAYTLKGLNPHGTLSARALRMYCLPKQSAELKYASEQEFSLLTKGIIFKDYDEASFVAYNSKDGKYTIWAAADKKAKIEKEIKKAGGAAAYVGASNEKATKAVSNKRGLSFKGR